MPGKGEDLLLGIGVTQVRGSKRYKSLPFTPCDSFVICVRAKTSGDHYNYGLNAGLEELPKARESEGKDVEVCDSVNVGQIPHVSVVSHGMFLSIIPTCNELVTDVVGSYH